MSETAGAYQDTTSQPPNLPGPTHKRSTEESVVHLLSLEPAGIRAAILASAATMLSISLSAITDEFTRAAAAAPFGRVP